MTKQLFCLMGLPLSGKSYVGKLLASRLPDATYISTGDIARAMIKGDEEQKQMEALDLYPGEDMLRAELKKLIDGATQSTIIVDGFPRFPDQAKHLADEYFHLFPSVIEVTTADLTTLAMRAKHRARDIRDTDPVQYVNRLKLAIHNQADVAAVLDSRMIKHYTIVSTASIESILSQFKYIEKDSK